MKKNLWILILLLFLTGCWDQHLLKDTNLIIGLGFDATPDGQILATINVLPPGGGASAGKSEKGGGAEGGQGAPVVTGIGATPLYAQVQAERKVSQNLTAARVQVILIGEDLAKKGIRPMIQAFYRDPLHSSLAPIAIGHGTANKLITTASKADPELAIHVTQRIKNQEKRISKPDISVQAVMRIIASGSQDVMLPYHQLKGDNIETTGYALFHGSKMVRLLDLDSAVLALLLAPTHVREGYLTVKLGNFSPQPWNNNITMMFRNMKDKMKVEVHGDKPEQIVVHLYSNVTASALELPITKPLDEKTKKAFEAIIEKKTNEQARIALAKMQAVNCDFYGIALYLQAHHPEVWKKLDWEKDFKKIKFDPFLDFNILNAGVIK